MAELPISAGVPIMGQKGQNQDFCNFRAMLVTKTEQSRAILEHSIPTDSSGRNLGSQDRRIRQTGRGSEACSEIVTNLHAGQIFFARFMTLNASSLL